MFCVLTLVQLADNAFVQFSGKETSGVPKVVQNLDVKPVASRGTVCFKDRKTCAGRSRT